MLTRTFLLRWLCATTTGILLALPYLFPSAYLLSWFAWVPLLSAVRSETLAKTYFWGLLSGLTCYTVATYWIADFALLFKGYPPIICALVSLIYWLYCAQLPALLIAGFVVLQRQLTLHPIMIFPPLLVLFYACYPMLFPVQLGESQSHFLIALQAIEFTGVYGLDAIMALTNITLFCLASKTHDQRIAVAGALALLTCWFGYGTYAYNQWDNITRTWATKKIGIVQPNEAPIATPATVYSGFSRAYPPEMAMTERLAQAGAELVLWPEASTKLFFAAPHVASAYQAEIARLDVQLIFQDMELLQTPSTQTSTQTSTPPRYFNTVTALASDGEIIGSYRKIKRIAFGETLPLIDQVPWLAAAARDYFGDFFQDISAGDRPSVFAFDNVTMVPLICYEALFPRFAANASRQAQQEKQGAVLAVFSNDGWFGDSHQPFQHINASVLRAVENRLPMVHVVNNGPSVVVGPTGEIIAGTPFNTAGGYLVDVPVNSENTSTFFNRHPDLFLSCVWLFLAAITIPGLWQRIKRHRQLPL